MWPVLAPALATAVIGAIAGSQAQKTKTSSGINLAPESDLEQLAGDYSQQNLRQLQNLSQLGPGMETAPRANIANEQLAALLSQFSASGGLPTEQDTSTAQQYAQSVFQPQAVELQQQAQVQQQRAAQLASQLGRPVNDPFIQSRLSQELMQGQERLSAQRGAFAAQTAQALPQQRLGYTAQLADVRNALASQALANRQAILSLGQQIQGAERNFRVSTAERTGTQTSGGGTAGMLSGAIGGFGAGLGAANLFQAPFSAGMMAQAAAPSPLSQSIFSGVPQQQPVQSYLGTSFSARPTTPNYLGTSFGGRP